MTAQASGENIAGDQKPEVALHAPGVWSVTASGAIKARRSLDNGSYETRWVAALIECAPIIEGEKDANGCLIAAAPDMLALLKTIADIAEGSRTTNSLPHVARLARAAIAKAEGL
jgi:hypothetical protein